MKPCRTPEVVEILGNSFCLTVIHAPVFSWKFMLSHDQLQAASLIGRNAVTWRDVEHYRMITASRSTGSHYVTSTRYILCKCDIYSTLFLPWTVIRTVRIFRWQTWKYDDPWLKMSHSGCALVWHFQPWIIIFPCPMLIVVRPTTGCFADWSKRRLVTLSIMECQTIHNNLSSDIFT